MIETPRAALTAATIAEQADFFSFGTNDLTQMTLGFSCDDIESKLMGPYLEQGLLDANCSKRSTPKGWRRSCSRPQPRLGRYRPTSSLVYAASTWWRY
ncbi:MAG: putative PEP-binding protein [Acidimicrobiales bacterium]